MLTQRLFGRDGKDPYLTRVKLSPQTRWGRLYLHIIHGPDPDPDPHDHPWDFWTLPLRSYTEEVLLDNGSIVKHVVPAGRWSSRKAWYTHRILGPTRKSWKRTLFTLVWRGPVRRMWGFWPLHDDPKLARLRPEQTDGLIKGDRMFVWANAYLGDRWRNI